MPDIKPVIGVWAIVNPEGEIIINSLSYNRSFCIYAFEKKLFNGWKNARKSGYKCVKVDVQWSWSNIKLKL